MARKSKPGLLYTSFHIVVHSNFKISPFVSTFLLVVFIAQNKGISKPYKLLYCWHSNIEKLTKWDYVLTYTADDISTNMQLWNFSTVRQLKTAISDCDWWFMVLPVCSIFSTSINRYLTKYCQFVQHFVYELLHYLEYGSE